MSLRYKTVAVVVVTFALLLLLAGVAMRVILLRSYIALEAQDITTHIQRARNEILDELSGMEATVLDWTWWTDTYEFVQGKYDGYADENLVDLTLLNLGINFMWFGDASGQEVQSLMVDLDAGVDVPVPDSLRAYLESNPSLLTSSDQFGTTSAIIMPSEGPMLVAFGPILTNDGDGPAAGVMIIGRYLDETLVQQVSEVTKLPLSLYRLDDPQFPDDATEALALISEDTPFVSAPVDEDVIAGYTLLEDVSGESALMLSVTAPRDIYWRGRDSFALFGQTVFVIALVTISVIMVAFQKLVLSRVEILSHQATEIAASGDFSTRLEERSNDELTELTVAFNVVLDSLSEAHTAVSRANDQLEERVAQRTVELQEANAQLVEEVAERTRAQADLTASLEEKEVLLKEVYHRVKNNMQVISSLLSLQAKQAEDPKTLSTLRDSRGRIRSMSLVHEQLYQTENLTHIELKPYLENLTSHLLRLYGKADTNISFDVQSDDVSLAIDDAIPCGLIVTELVSNSLKYAFDGQPEGQIVVQAHQNGAGRIILRISDDGPGLPAELDIAKARSLGLTLIHSLSRQLRGALEIDPETATFSLVFSPNA